MKKIIKYTPQHFLLYGFICYLIMFMIGPYKWEIRDWNAIFAMIMGYIVMYLGMLWYKKIGKKYIVKINTKHNSNLQQKSSFFELSLMTEYVMVAIEIVVILSFFVFLKNISLFVNISNISEIQDTRSLLGDNLSGLQKLSQYIILASIPIYIITNHVDNIRIKVLQYLRTFCFWLPAISFLIISARWNFVLSLFIFLMVNKKNKNKNVKNDKKKGMIISILFIIVAIFIVFSLFETRGNSDLIPNKLRYYGEIEIKSSYKTLPFYSKGFCQFFLYFNHSVPYYANIYKFLDFGHSQFGTYAFSHLRIIIPYFDNWDAFAKYNEVLLGDYTPTITGFFVDFGFWGSFFAMFLTGVIFELISIKANTNSLMYCLKPIILFQCFMSLEGYIWNVGSSNIVIFITIIIYCIVFVSNSISIRNNGRK